ncbi:hypothetical protein L1887_52812 [Cichorium endivia]|nr:hypothetical protein L1887_52812 [Cichorium endivia]
MGRSEQYKQRKESVHPEEDAVVNGDQSVDLSGGRAASSSVSIVVQIKEKAKETVEEECLSDNTESSNQPRSDNSSDCESSSEPENDLVQSAAALAKQQNQSSDKVKLFDEYESCENAAQLLQTQNNVLEQQAKEDLERRNEDIYPHFSSDEELDGSHETSRELDEINKDEALDDEQSAMSERL